MRVSGEPNIISPHILMNVIGKVIPIESFHARFATKIRVVKSSKQKMKKPCLKFICNICAVDGGAVEDKNVLAWTGESAAQSM